MAIPHYGWICSVKDKEESTPDYTVHVNVFITVHADYNYLEDSDINNLNRIWAYELEAFEYMFKNHVFIDLNGICGENILSPEEFYHSVDYVYVVDPNNINITELM